MVKKKIRKYSKSNPAHQALLERPVHMYYVKRKNSNEYLKGLDDDMKPIHTHKLMAETFTKKEADMVVSVMGEEYEIEHHPLYIRLKKEQQIVYLKEFNGNVKRPVFTPNKEEARPYENDDEYRLTKIALSNYAKENGFTVLREY